MNINQPPKNFSVLFLDMNSFFASVEQQVRPELRGKPIGIAPYTGDSGCIIAASREAKAAGVSISRIGEAKKILPQIKILEARPALYMLYHKEIRQVIESFTPFYEVLSIDEFAISLTPLDQNEQSATVLARKIKSKIREKVGDFLTCSVGIGPSKFLAKMAAESKKPDGLVVLKLNELNNFYAKSKLTDLVGINHQMSFRLQCLKIHTPLEFFNCSLDHLARVLNHPGKGWFYRLRGYEIDDLNSQTKTIGHSHVLEPELRSREAALSVLKKLVFKAGYRLRHQKFLANGVYLNIGFSGGGHFSQSMKFQETFSDNFTFWQKVLLLVNKCDWRGRPFYLAVGAFGLKQNNGEQISIFREIEKRESLVKALDQVNDTYGQDTVIPASMMMAGESAPDRIPFGRPRYDILH